MERYTEWLGGRGAGLPGKDCYTRLAMYEDSELSPEQVVVLAEKDKAIDSIENSAYLHSAKCPKCLKSISRGYKEDIVYCSGCGQKVHIPAFSEDEINKALFEHEMDEYED